MNYHKFSLEERNALKDTWVSELRSGKYAQVMSHLHVKGKGFCCLGVLANCVDPVWTHFREGGIDVMENSFAVAETYDDISDFVGSSELASVLYGMNDIEKKSFDEIADYIDAHWDNTIGAMKHKKGERQ